MFNKLILGLFSLCVVILGAGCGLIGTSDSSDIITGVHVSQLEYDHDNLYFGAGYCLYRLNVISQELHSISCTEKLIFGNLVVDDQNIYVFSEDPLTFDDYLSAIDKQSNQMIWHQERLLGKEADPFSVDDQRLYTVGLQGIWAWDKPTGKVLWVFKNKNHLFLEQDHLLWVPAAHNELGYEDGILLGMDPQTGEVRQSINLLPQRRFDQLIYLDEQWILGSDTRQKPYTVFAINRTTGNIAWENQAVIHAGSRVEKIARNDNWITLGNAAAMVKLDLATGKIIWSADIEGNKVVSPTQKVSHSIGVIVDSDREYSNQTGYNIYTTLYGVEGDLGQIVWIYKCNTVGDMITLEDKVYRVDQDTIMALDIQTGQLLWQVKVDAAYKKPRAVYP